MSQESKFLYYPLTGPWTSPLGDYASAWVKVTQAGDPQYPDIQLYLSPAVFSMDMGFFIPYIYNFDKAVRHSPISKRQGDSIPWIGRTVVIYSHSVTVFS